MQFNIIDLSRAVVCKAGYYLWPNSTPRRIFTIGIGCLFLLFIGLFIGLSYAGKYHMVDTWIYHQKQFRLKEGGWPEIFGHLLEAFTVIMLYLKARRDKQAAWFAWALIFVVVELDDSLQIHETAGALIHRLYDLKQAYAELICFGFLGLFSGFCWIAGIVALDKTRNHLAAYFLLTVYFSVLAFFGIGIDFLHASLEEKFRGGEAFWALIEDGSELLLLCMYAITVLNLYFDDSLKSVKDNNNSA